MGCPSVLSLISEVCKFRRLDGLHVGDTLNWGGRGVAGWCGVFMLRGMIWGGRMQKSMLRDCYALHTPETCILSITYFWHSIFLCTPKSGTDWSTWCVTFPNPWCCSSHCMTSETGSDEDFVFFHFGLTPAHYELQTPDTCTLCYVSLNPNLQHSVHYVLLTFAHLWHLHSILQTPELHTQYCTFHTSHQSVNFLKNCRLTSSSWIF